MMTEDLIRNRGVIRSANGCAVLLLMLLVWLYAAPAVNAGPLNNDDVIVDFEDLTLPDGVDYWNGADGSGAFFSRGVNFTNNYNSDWETWSGFAYSRVNDTTTPGWENQYAVISGAGFDGAGIYAVAYAAADDVVVTFPAEAGVRGIYVNNTTYTALDMEYGSAFSKKFGGADGDDPDWFKLTVSGYEADGSVSGSAWIYLADYRFEDNEQNYILKDWTWLSLTNLGNTVKTLRFELSSSDTGTWGMNTPAYFALGRMVLDGDFPAQPTVTISNLAVAQRPGTKLVDITYDIAGLTEGTAAVELTVKNGDDPVTAVTLTGDIGAGVSMGAGKAIVWDMEADWNRNAAELTIILTADEDAS